MCIYSRYWNTCITQNRSTDGQEVELEDPSPPGDIPITNRFLNCCSMELLLSRFAFRLLWEEAENVNLLSSCSVSTRPGRAHWKLWRWVVLNSIFFSVVIFYVSLTLTCLLSVVVLARLFYVSFLCVCEWWAVVVCDVRCELCSVSAACGRADDVVFSCLTIAGGVGRKALHNKVSIKSQHLGLGVPYLDNMVFRRLLKEISVVICFSMSSLRWKCSF